MNGLSSTDGECGYRIPADDLPVPVIRYDATGRRLGMNAAAVAMMSFPAVDSGCPRDEADLLSRPALQRYLNAIGEVAAGGGPAYARTGIRCRS